MAGAFSQPGPLVGFSEMSDRNLTCQPGRVILTRCSASQWTFFDQSPITSETECLCVDVDGYRIVNVYKPPSMRLQASDLQCFLTPIFIAGDFNCPHVNWGYRTSSADGECLVAWASLNGLVPRHHPKDVATFHSGRWNTGTNPDLTFVSVYPDTRVPDRRILKKIPR